jgi:membrane fusion protein (multidrug efflux system)
MSEQKSNQPNQENSPIEAGEKAFYLKKRIIIPLILLVIGCAFAWFWYQGTLGYVSTDDAFIDGNRLSMSSKILGRITNLYGDEGDSVKSGEVLVRIDSTDLVAQKNQIISSLKLAEVNLQLSKVGLDKAQEDYNRAQIQFKANIIPKEQLDHAQKAFQSASAQVEIDKSKIENAKAQLDVIIIQLKNTTIYSPMDGVIAKRWVLEGNVVQPGEPIFSIYDVKNIWVTANLQETDISAVRKSRDVEISIDSYPDQQFKGKVLLIGSNTASQFSLIPPNNAAGNFTKVTQRIPVKISIEPVKGQEKVNLLPGMSAIVKIKVKG